MKTLILLFIIWAMGIIASVIHWEAHFNDEDMRYESYLMKEQSYP